MTKLHRRVSVILFAMNVILTIPYGFIFISLILNLIQLNYKSFMFIIGTIATYRTCYVPCNEKKEVERTEEEYEQLTSTN